MAKKKKGRAADEGPDSSAPRPPPSPALIICRNKHWRFISAFHGPWITLPPEILETLANTNYYTPRPRPIDPAVFYDLVKIRRLVDEASDMVLRVANDAPIGGGGGGNRGRGLKLSPERKLLMRKQAVQKLGRAYYLDEIACSVATMQGVSSLEDVGSLVLQRSPDDVDAKYVHFFHEKIPSRQLAESTELAPLNEIIALRPNEAEPLRTRATVRVFKNDLQGALSDLTEALKAEQTHSRPHSSDLVAAGAVQTIGRRYQDTPLAEKDQPSSLRIQLLFQRASVHLGIACHHVDGGLPEPSRPGEDNGPESDTADGQEGANSSAAEGNGDTPEAGLSAPDQDAQKRQLLSRKRVKAHAELARRDYMAYIEHFDYSPNLPIEIAEDFTHRATLAMKGVRNQRASTFRSDSPTSTGTSPPHTVYDLGQLFTATPPPDLPPYPSTEVVAAPSRQQQQQPQQPSQAPADAHLVSTTTETLTYHPLLSDALHSLLLCHALKQTSPTELLRHAYMVARLTRLADGYPVFQASRPPARTDWIEVLRRAGGDAWLTLSATWEHLCYPAPLPLFQGSNPAPEPLASAPAPTPAPTPLPLPDGPLDTNNNTALVPAPVDGSDAPLTDAQFARWKRQKHADEDYYREEQVHNMDAKLVVPGGGAAAAAVSPAKPTLPPPQSLQQQQQQQARGPVAVPAPRRWAKDDGREYPMLTERAAAVARWVLEAPATVGARRKKRRAKAKGKAKARGKGDDDGEGEGEVEAEAEAEGREDGEDGPEEEAARRVGEVLLAA